MKIKLKNLKETFQNFAQEALSLDEQEKDAPTLDYDPDKTPPLERDPNLERSFVLKQQMKKLEKEGWTFEKTANGWTAHNNNRRWQVSKSIDLDNFKNPNSQKKNEANLPTDKEEEFVIKNKDKYKKIYGTNYKKYLYGNAKKKFGKKDTIKQKKEK